VVQAFKAPQISFRARLQGAATCRS